MDAKIVLLTMLIVNLAAGVSFNFHDKLRNVSLLATTTTKMDIATSQVIRVPLLDCPTNQKRDALGQCRTIF